MAQRRTPTNAGTFEDETMGIASSDKTAPKTRLQLVEDNGLTVINGQEHAEWTLMNAGAKHADTNRPACLDCQNKMKENGVTTDTSFSGKKSRNRL